MGKKIWFRLAGSFLKFISTPRLEYTIFLPTSRQRNFIGISSRNKTSFDISSGARIIPSLITRLANNNGIINLRFTMPGELKIPSLSRGAVHADSSFLFPPSLNLQKGKVEENRINIRQSSEDSFFPSFSCFLLDYNCPLIGAN